MVHTINKFILLFFLSGFILISNNTKLLSDEESMINKAQSEVFRIVSLDDIASQLANEIMTKNDLKVWINEISNFRPQGRQVSENYPDVSIVVKNLTTVVRDVLKQGLLNNGFDVFTGHVKDSRSNQTIVQNDNLITIDCEIISFWIKTYEEKPTGGRGKYFTYAEVAFRIIQKDINSNQEIKSFYLVGDSKFNDIKKPDVDTYKSLFKSALEESVSDIAKYFSL